MNANDSDTAGLGGVVSPNLLPTIEPERRRMAQWKMDGDTDIEIVARLRKAVPTVERRLVLIRKKWERADEGTTDS